MDHYNKFLSSIANYERLLQNLSKSFDTYNALSSVTKYEQLTQKLSKTFDAYNRTFERLAQMEHQLQKMTNSVVFTSASIEQCLDIFERMREGLITNIIPHIERIQALRDMLSLLDPTLPEFLDVPTTPEVIEEPECTSTAVSEDIPNKRFTFQDVIALLSLLLTMLGMLTSAIDSRQAEIRHHQEMQIKEEELRLKEKELCLMEEQRDYVASVCEQLLTILDDSESTPSPSPTLEPTPPMSDTAEISFPLESVVVLGTETPSDDISDGQSKNSETD